METIGKVRLLPVGTPGLPPREQNMELWCDERIEVQHVPMRHDRYTVAYLCTRLPHSADEPHVSEPDDLMTGRKNADPFIIVWGGE